MFRIPDDLYGERVATVILRRNWFYAALTDLTSDCRDRPAASEIPE